MTHNGPVDTIRSSSLLLCASKEGYETPQQQWMSLLIAYHSISHAKRVPQSGILGTSLRVHHSRNDTVWTTRGSYILQEAPPTLLMHLRPHMNHFNNNGCLSLQHRVPFLMQKGYPKYYVLCEIWESTSAEMTQCDRVGACRCCSKIPPPSVYIKCRLWTTSTAMNVFPYSTTSHFLCWEGTPNLTFYVQFEC